MKTVRRLYFYAVALISLEVVLWGLIGLLRTIVDRVSVGGGEALARALALILVGIPIFLVHWGWAQAASRRDPEEKTASLRAVFLYAALLGTLIPVVQNLLALINRLLLEGANISPGRALLGGSQSWPDNLIAIAMNLLVAAYFWTTLNREWETLPNAENFAEVRRLYRYIWLLYSLLMAVLGAQQIVRFIFYIPSNVVGLIGRVTFVNGLALLLIGTPIWVYTWRVCQRALTDPDEKASMLRLGVLYLLAVGGVAAVLASTGTLIYMLLKQLVGQAAPAAEFAQRIGAPISVAVPLVVVWAYYGAWLNRHIDAAAEDLRQQEALKRPYYYILSLSGLVAAFTGAALLMRIIINQALSSALMAPGFLGDRISAAVAPLLVGLPLWVWAWLRMERQARDEGLSGAHARRSIVRKGYLYLVLFASVIGGMAAAVALIFQVLKALLNSERLADFLAPSLNSLQLLLLFAVVLVYHLSALRRDGLSRGEIVEMERGQFPVLVIGEGAFAESMRLALGKQSQRLLVAVMAPSGQLPPETEYQAVVLPAGLVLDPPETLRDWLGRFAGRRIIVPDGAGSTLLAGSAQQASRIAAQLADGQELRLSRPASTAWQIVIYVFAALFALQLLFMGLMLGISSIVNR
jgi:hypothetical protein